VAVHLLRTYHVVEPISEVAGLPYVKRNVLIDKITLVVQSF